MFGKRLALMITVFLCILFFPGTPVMAANIPYVVEINDDDDPGADIVTLENVLKVQVRDYNCQEHAVKVGGVKAERYGPGRYGVDNYLLKTGKNSVTVAVDNYKDTYKITYVDEAIPGSSYYLPAIPTSGTITAINKTFSLKFPKNNYILNVDDPDSPEIAEDQSLIIKVVNLNKEPTQYHNFISPVYTVAPAGSEFDDTKEHDEAAVLYPGELTLKYDAGISIAAADNLTVIYVPYKEWDDDDWESGDDFSDYWDDDWPDRECVVLGGRVDASGRTITVPFSKTGFGTYAVFNVNRVFYDLLDSNDDLTWAQKYVLAVWAKGVMEKTGSGEVFGNEVIAREEFTASIVKAMGISVEEGLQNPFEDLTGSNLAVDEYKDYILTAAKKSIICGFPTPGGAYFRPEQGLTREQAATIIARVADLKVNDNEAAAEAGMAKAFHDYAFGGFSSWASPYIYAAYKAGFIGGSPVEVNGKVLYNFNPKMYLTRSEAAKLIYQLMKKQKKF